MADEESGLAFRADRWLVMAVRLEFAASANELVASGDKKLARQAAHVRAAMNRNKELLVEGQIPAGLIEPVN